MAGLRARLAGDRGGRRQRRKVHVLADTGECGAGGARPAGRGLAPPPHGMAKRLQRDRSACTRPGAGRVGGMWGGVGCEPGGGRVVARDGTGERVEEGAGWNAPGGAPVRAFLGGSWRLRTSNFNFACPPARPRARPPAPTPKCCGRRQRSALTQTLAAG